MREDRFPLPHDDRDPFARAPGYCEPFCEDPDHLEREVVAPIDP